MTSGPHRRPSWPALVAVIALAVAVGYALTELASLPGAVAVIAMTAVVIGGLLASQAGRRSADVDH